MQEFIVDLAGVHDAESLQDALALVKDGRYTGC